MNEKKYFSDIYTFQIEGNIVITTLKVATSTCCSIASERTGNKMSYDEIRDLSEFELFLEDRKLKLRTKALTRDKVKSDDSLQFIKDITDTFKNIISGKSDKKIYILCREPHDHWEAAIFEDLRNIISNKKLEDILNTLETKFNGSKFETEHLQLLSDYKSQHQGVPCLEDLFNYMKDVYESKYTTQVYNEFVKIYLEHFWWMILDPFKDYDSSNKMMRHLNIWNLTTIHYSPYLTQLWMLCIKLNYPDFMEFVDIKDNFKLISKISKKGIPLSKTNTRGTRFKYEWSNAFRNVSKEIGDVEIPGYLGPEKVVYGAIKEYKRK
jgi:hypothetical protein